MAKKKMTKKKDEEQEIEIKVRRPLIAEMDEQNRKVVRRRRVGQRYPILGAIVFLVGIVWLLFNLLTCFGSCSLLIPIILTIVGIILLIIGV